LLINNLKINNLKINNLKINNLKINNLNIIIMIERIIENNKIRFIFTKSHIYSYIHTFIETSDKLGLINLYLQNYDNKNKKNLFKEILIDMKYGDIIIDAIDKMMTSKSVDIEEDLELYVKGDGLICSFDQLFLNQNDYSLMPPINLP
jgi:hypothetical protein